MMVLSIVVSNQADAVFGLKPMAHSPAMKKAQRLSFGCLPDKTIWLVLSLACLVSAIPVRATTIYDNTVNQTYGAFSIGSREVGDQIQLAGTARSLTNFSCGYFLFVNQPQP